MLVSWITLRIQADYLIKNIENSPLTYIVSSVTDSFRLCDQHEHTFELKSSIWGNCLKQVIMFPWFKKVTEQCHCPFTFVEMLSLPYLRHALSLSLYPGLFNDPRAQTTLNKTHSNHSCQRKHYASVYLIYSPAPAHFPRAHACVGQYPLTPQRHYAWETELISAPSISFHPSSALGFLHMKESFLLQ